MMSFMAPEPQGVELDYAVGTVQTATVGTGALAKTWRCDAHGYLRIPFDPAMPANTPVVLSACRLRCCRIRSRLPLSTGKRTWPFPSITFLRLSSYRLRHVD